jgi:hypothetical protein
MWLPGPTEREHDAAKWHVAMEFDSCRLVPQRIHLDLDGDRQGVAGDRAEVIEPIAGLGKHRLVGQQPRPWWLAAANDAERGGGEVHGGGVGGREPHRLHQVARRDPPDRRVECHGLDEQSPVTGRDEHAAPGATRR